MVKYVFYTTCVDSDAVGPYGECINEMTQPPHAEDIDTETFAKDIAREHGFAEGLAEMFNHQSIRELVDDFALSCYRSRFQGAPCYYVKHSGIEHIFIPKDQLSSMVTGDDLMARQDVIDRLDDALDKFEPWLSSSTAEQQRAALSDFIQAHYDDFLQSRILLSSLFAYKTPYESIVRELDESHFFRPAGVLQTVELTARNDGKIFEYPETRGFICSELESKICAVLKSTYPMATLSSKGDWTLLSDREVKLTLQVSGDFCPNIAETVGAAIRGAGKGWGVSDATGSMQVLPGKPRTDAACVPDEPHARSPKLSR